MIARPTTLCFLLLTTAFPAHADDCDAERPSEHRGDRQGPGGCAPKDNMARVLKSANPLDNAANWTGKNYIGTGWTFMPKRYVVTALSGGIFLKAI